MRNINYKSDFLLLQRIYLKEHKGGDLKDIGFPKYDFKLYYYTVSPNNAYVAECKYDRQGHAHCTNCKDIDGKLIVVFNNHGLSTGDLKVNIEIEFPNEMYQDGYQREFIPAPTDVHLWDRPTEGYGMAEAAAIIPHIMGKDFTFDDFTPEQLDQIITKAAQKVLDESDEELKNRMDEIKKNIEDEIMRDLTESLDFTEEDLLEALCDIDFSDPEEKP